MTEFFQNIFAYYGLDWLTMFLGLWGSYLITKRRAVGFAMLFCSSLAALAVAMMSGQYGFIAYNTISMAIACKGYLGWSRQDVSATV
ncbi:MAG: hypothetical protein PHX61_04840 [Alphaproteobacteria bacterium]|nr:hypothetical protein [Alphaproteobacteria bacterium]OIN87547.1 MAG: hypothetical protein AUJ12_02145 [Alphaproteobacteria bacterium CG1_02_46_17]